MFNNFDPVYFFFLQRRFLLSYTLQTLWKKQRDKFYFWIWLFLKLRVKKALVWKRKRRLSWKSKLFFQDNIKRYKVRIVNKPTKLFFNKKYLKAVFFFKFFKKRAAVSTFRKRRRKFKHFNWKRRGLLYIQNKRKWQKLRERRLMTTVNNKIRAREEESRLRKRRATRRLQVKAAKARLRKRGTLKNKPTKRSLKKGTTYRGFLRGRAARKGKTITSKPDFKRLPLFFKGESRSPYAKAKRSQTLLFKREKSIQRLESLRRISKAKQVKKRFVARWEESLELSRVYKTSVKYQALARSRYVKSLCEQRLYMSPLVIFNKIKPVRTGYSTKLLSQTYVRGLVSYRLYMEYRRVTKNMRVSDAYEAILERPRRALRKMRDKVFNKLKSYKNPLAIRFGSSAWVARRFYLFENRFDKLPTKNLLARKRNPWVFAALTHLQKAMLAWEGTKSLYFLKMRTTCFFIYFWYYKKYFPQIEARNLWRTHQESLVKLEGKKRKKSNFKRRFTRWWMINSFKRTVVRNRAFYQELKDTKYRYQHRITKIFCKLRFFSWQAWVKLKSLTAASLILKNHSFAFVLRTKSVPATIIFLNGLSLKNFDILLVTGDVLNLAHSWILLKLLLKRTLKIIKRRRLRYAFRKYYKLLRLKNYEFDFITSTYVVISTSLPYWFFFKSYSSVFSNVYNMFNWKFII